MKRLAILLALCLLLVGSAPASAQVYVRGGDLSHSWTCSLVGLVATLTQCQALATGVTYYITDIVVQTTTTTAGSYAIQYGTGTNCGSGTGALFPSYATASRFLAPISTAPTADIALTTPLAAVVGNAICVIGTGTNTINIQLSGFYTP